MTITDRESGALDPAVIGRPCAGGESPAEENRHSNRVNRNAAMSLGKRRLRKAVVVCCRSGPGFRVVLCLLTLSGMPILETMPSTFATVEEARRFASEELGALPEQIQLRTKRA